MSVLSHLMGLASRLNVAEQETTSISLSVTTISSRLGSYFGSNVKDRFRFGSSTRKTMLPRSADAYSDVDYMIVFDNTNGYKPQTFISQLKEFAEYYYSRSEIYQSSPTVVLELGHINFDLVPSYKNVWGNLHIPAPTSSYTDWVYTDPLSLNSTVDQANVDTNYQLKPLIRLLKYWNAKNGYVYTSFELEQNLANMSFFFCSNLKDYVYKAVNNLSTWSLPEYKRQKVERAQQIVKNVRQYEQDDMPATAEVEIKKLFPDLG